MPLPETKQGALLELQSWQDLVTSESWVVYRRFLKDHVDFLQKEVNEHVRKHEDRQAGESLRAMDDANKMLLLATKRIAELNRINEKER